MSAKLGVTKKFGAPNNKLLPWPLKRSVVLRPSVPGKSDVLSSKVRSAVYTLAGISGRAQAEPIVSLGPAMFMASMKSAELAVATAFRSAVNPILPMAALVPFRNRMRRMTSPRTAMLSGFLNRLWQDAV